MFLMIQFLNCYYIDKNKIKIHQTKISNKVTFCKILILVTFFRANLELNAIKKQNDAETLKLKALVRKAELKSKSLEETVEQKTKENKELTQIIDEMIARVE